MKLQKNKLNIIELNSLKNDVINSLNPSKMKCSTCLKWFDKNKLFFRIFIKKYYCINCWASFHKNES